MRPLGASSAGSTIARLQEHHQSLLNFVDVWATEHNEMIHVHEEHLERLFTNFISPPDSMRDANRLVTDENLAVRLDKMRNHDSHKLVANDYMQALVPKQLQADPLHFAPLVEGESKLGTSETPEERLFRSRGRMHSLQQENTAEMMTAEESEFDTAVRQSQSSVDQTSHDFHGSVAATQSDLRASEKPRLDRLKSASRSNTSFRTRSQTSLRYKSVPPPPQRYSVFQELSQQCKRFSKTTSLASSVQSFSDKRSSEAFEAAQMRVRRASKAVQMCNVDAEDIEPSLPPLKRFLLHSRIFYILCAAMILVNVIVICIETEYEANTLTNPDVFHKINLGLNAWYFVEMCLKIYAHKMLYFTGPDKAWNWLDMLLVCLSVFDIFFAMQLGGKQNMARSFRVVRLARLVRNVRIIRYLNFAHDFKKMIMSLCACLSTLFWALTTFVCVTLTFAMVLVQLVVGVRVKVEYEKVLETSEAYVVVREHFKTIPTSMYYMLESVTGGLNWGSLAAPLYELDRIAFSVFVCYLLFSIFGVLNVVTGVFVEGALQATEYYRELLVEKKRRQKENYIQHVREIFKHIDGHASGLVTVEEIQCIFTDPELEEFIEALELNATDAVLLFHLLDFDGSGNIDADEFCNGCLKLKGEAKSFDVYCLIYQNERSLHQTNNFIASASETLEKNTQLLKNLVRSTQATKELFGASFPLCEHDPKWTRCSESQDCTLCENSSNEDFMTGGIVKEVCKVTGDPTPEINDAESLHSI